MAFKNLEDLITKEMSCGPGATFKSRLKNELIDYLAHHPGRYCYSINKMDNYDVIIDFVKWIVDQDRENLCD